MYTNHWPSLHVCAEHVIALANPWDVPNFVKEEDLALFHERLRQSHTVVQSERTGCNHVRAFPPTNDVGLTSTDQSGKLGPL